ncbi:MAG: signal recognition particle-docking protein FtsY [Thermoprotei archaeon]|nr:signal recognition particle-docking protein FtsY [Thermoprotei archaeon]
MVFEALKSALNTLVNKVKYRTPSEREISALMDEILLELLSADVAYEAALDMLNTVRDSITGKVVARGVDVGEVVRLTIRDYMLKTLNIPQPDIIEAARGRCGAQRPYVIVFFGVNGVGKTTTIAKVAYAMKKRGLTVVLAASDTFRAGAQEQLEIHAERLGVPIVKGRYGSDPASVAHDAIEYARKRGYCAVLIDTAGRMHVDADLMDEMKKIVRVAKPDMKIMVVDALTGNDAKQQAEEFNEKIGIDAVIVTKTDSDAKGGSIISIVTATGKPVIYVGTGQSYEDLEAFNPSKYVDTILGSTEN